MQIPHPANFRFPSVIPHTSVESVGKDCFRLCVQNGQEPTDCGLDLPATSPVAGDAGLRCDSQGLRWLGPDGTCWLEGDGLDWFGQSGESWMIRLRHADDMRFYGLGQKAGSLEKTKLRTHMWNVDVWGHHPIDAARNGIVDPQYISIPWLIIDRRINGVCKALGIFVHHPGQVFFSLNPEMRLHPSQDPVPGGSFYLGAPSDRPELWLMAADNVEALAAKFSRLVGTMPCPPMWALGNHQCRWGYEGRADLEELDRKFREHQIPCDGLWLDIDYMDGYRVFTTHPERMANAEQWLATLRASGRRVVAILDPGVKDEVGFPIREEGIAQDLFCRNSNGDFFRGFVWPGATLFPDFSLSETQAWWAEHVQKLTALGFAGFWVDMNDPSTGAVPPEDMLFGRGQKAHAKYRNLYANGMAKATQVGLRAAHPSEIPFVLTRSASTGIARYSGVWMGDNFSNWFHLQQSIPMALNLSLSGVPFVGADIPGFGDDAEPELMERWVQAHCFFPFFRNHSVKDSIRQEPWVFGAETLDIVRKYIRLRYQWLPYFQELFLEHERSGALVLRPYLCGDNSTDAHLVEDEYLLGADLLVAPILQKGKQERSVRFPTGQWLREETGAVYEGGKSVTMPCARNELLWFVRVGAKLPRLRVIPKHSTDEIDWTDVYYG